MIAQKSRYKSGTVSSALYESLSHQIPLHCPVILLPLIPRLNAFEVLPADNTSHGRAGTGWLARALVLADALHEVIELMNFVGGMR